VSQSRPQVEIGLGLQCELPLLGAGESTRVDPVPDELLRLLYRQVRALAGPRPNLDDLVQAAAERAVRSWPRFEGRSALSTWTYGIAYRTMLDHDRWYVRWRRRFRLGLDAEPEQAADWDGEQGLIEVMRARRLHAALDRLAPAKRAVVTLRDLEGLELKEIALIVGANERTVRSRLRDGRRRLVELLSPDPLFQRSSP
jgi:RNA polymerase sigma-70 factor, ECF subfamily